MTQFYLSIPLYLYYFFLIFLSLHPVFPAAHLDQLVPAGHTPRNNYFKYVS